MDEHLGALVARVARLAAREEVEAAVASIATLGTAASAPYADPDGSGRTVVDVQIGNDVWPAVVVRSGESIAQGDRLIVLMFGHRHSSGWLVMKA